MGYGSGARWAALDFGEEREIAQLLRLWESIELEIIRVLETGHALKESPDYELHRLTTRTPAFFDETVRRHVEGLEKELTMLESEAEKLAKEIEELTGEAASGRGREGVALPERGARASPELQSLRTRRKDGKRGSPLLVRPRKR
jgi:hypothetical protein